MMPPELQSLSAGAARAIDASPGDALHLAGMPATELAAKRRAVMLDLTQIGLALVGVADPTPTADGIDLVISVARGDPLGATLSALSIIPYVGDAAKLARVGDMIRSLQAAADLARIDPAFARDASPALQVIDGALARLPADRLPAAAEGELAELRGSLDAALDAAHAPRTSRLSAEAAGETLAGADDWIRHLRERIRAQPGRDPEQVRREVIDAIEDPATRSFVESATRSPALGAPRAPDYPGPMLDAPLHMGGKRLPAAGALAGVKTPAEAAERIDMLEVTGGLRRLDPSSHPSAYNNVFVTEEGDRILRVSKRAIPDFADARYAEVRAAVAASRLGVGPTVHVAESAVFAQQGYLVLTLERFGQPLRHVAGAPQLSGAQRSDIAVNMAGQVAELHRMNWFHGDLHPGNVLVERDASVRLTDFARAGRFLPGREFAEQGLRRDLADLFDRVDELRPQGADPTAWRRRAADAYLEGLERAPNTGVPPGTLSPASEAHRGDKVERARAIIAELVR